MKFELTPEQVAKFEGWRKSRPPQYYGTIGGRYTFTFNPTSLGNIIKILDEANGDELDLTEYENW